MIFGIVIGPSLAKMTPQGRTEFFVKVIPKFLRYVEGFAILTVVFGVITAAAFLNGDFSSVSFSTSFGRYISIGAVIALVAIGLAFTVITPTARKIVRISEGLMKTPGPPPPELLAASKRLKVSTTVALVLLIIVTMFMVAGATGL